MTVATTTRKAGPFSGNAATTSFPFSFKVFTKADVLVVRANLAGAETILVLDSDYSVAVNADQNASPGGTITYPISGLPLPVGSTLAIVGNMSYAQGSQLPSGGSYNAQTVESALDKNTILSQQLLELINRSLKTAISTPTGVSSTLPAPVPYALLGWNASGTGLQNTDASGGTSTLVLDLAGSGGADKVGFLQAGAGAVPRTLQSKYRETISVTDFGAVGDGVANDAPAIQAAINSLGLTGGVILFPKGRYKINTVLIANSGVLLKGSQRSDITTNTNGSGSSASMIVWGGGIVASWMYTIKPATIGNVVWGGGTEDIEWDGASKVNGAVHFDNTKFSLFDGKIRNVTYAGIVLSSISGSPSNFSQMNHVRKLEFIYGASAACDAANGVVMMGNNTTVPSTQQQIGSVTGLTNNGFGVVIGETDNCFIDYVNIAALGTGGGVKLNSGGAQNANFNMMKYVAGRIDWGVGLNGNRILHYISEGGGFIGASQWDGDVVDYVTGRSFSSHRYAMRKWIDFKPGDFVGDTNTGQTEAALQWRTLTFPNAGSPKAASLLVSDYDLSNGKIIGLDFFYATNGTAGGDLLMVFSLSTVPVGNKTTLVTPEHTYQIAVPQMAQYTLAKFSYTIAPTLAFTMGDTIALSVARLSANALDTATDEVQLIGVRLNYESTGPDSSGSGTYFVPAWA